MTVPSIQSTQDNVEPIITEGLTSERDGILNSNINLSPAALCLMTANNRKNFVRKFAMEFNFAAECFGAKIKY